MYGFREGYNGIAYSCILAVYLHKHTMLEGQSEGTDDHASIHDSLSKLGMPVHDLEQLGWRPGTPLCILNDTTKQAASGYLVGNLTFGGSVALKGESAASDPVTIIPSLDLTWRHRENINEVVAFDDDGNYYICVRIDAADVDPKTLETYVPSVPSHEPKMLVAQDPFDMKTMQFFTENETIFLRLMHQAATEALAFRELYSGKDLPTPIADFLPPTLEWATRPREERLEQGNPMPTAITNQFRPDALAQQETGAIVFVAFARIPQRAGDVQQALLEQGKTTHTLVGRLMNL